MTFRLRHLLAALVLHGLLIALLVGGVQCTRPPTRPPVIQAVLLDPDRKEAAQQKRADEQQRRQQAETERKRQEQEARRKVEQEQQRREAAAEAQKKKQLAEAAERKKAEDQRRQKELAEQKKAEDLARRKKEQEDKREAQEAAQREIQEKARMEETLRREAIEREAAREQAARAATELEAAQSAWASLLSAHVQKYWIRPASAPPEFECLVRVQLLPDGTVTSANITQTCGNSALDKSVEDAVLRSSPMPRPANPRAFDRTLEIRFIPRPS
jgi:colicin import membrane protein